MINSFFIITVITMNKKIIVILVTLIFVVSAFSAGATKYYNFESGPQGWTATGLWHWVNPSNSDWANARSGVGSFWYGDEDTGDFDTGTRNWGALTSPPLNNPYRMTFCTWWEVEGGDYFDRMEIRANDEDGYLFLLLNTGPMTSGGYGEEPTWVKHTVDLSQYPGTTRVVFYFDTIDASYNDLRGWYIDDVTIYERSSLPMHQIAKIVGITGLMRE